MIEYEKKFLLTKEEYLKLIKSLCGDATPVIQINHYYDTNNYELNDKGITCRIREKNNKFTATIKTHLQEESIERSKSVISEQDISLFEDYDVKYQGKLTTHRTKVFCGDGYKFFLDRNEYLYIEDFELEAEYANGDETVLLSPLELISNTLNIDINNFLLRSIEAQNKSQRFFTHKKELYNFAKPQKALDTISNFRNSKTQDINKEKCNRFCVTFNEKDNSQTAYYFSTPIYNKYSKKYINNEFVEIAGGFIAEGSNSMIKIFDNIRLEKQDKFCEIQLDKKVTCITPIELSIENDRIFLTTNGFLYIADISNKNNFTFDIITNDSYLTPRFNNQCFSLLEDVFTPFVTISCLGASKTPNCNLKPAYLEYVKTSDTCYSISTSPYDKQNKYLFFEINIYERKAIQDTTVESNNPQKNNAYGGIAFIGNSDAYGEQWLYSKFDYSILKEIANKKIEKAIWHLPKYNYNFSEISVWALKSRFCSFGSNWTNKNDNSNFIGFAVDQGNYIDIDITPILLEAQKRNSMYSDGIILKPRFKKEGYTAVSTGDNYFKPQIIEISYT